MRKFLAAVLAAAALSGSARGDAMDDMDDVAARILKQAPMTGFSIGIARAGRIVAERGYGDARPGTVFHINSVTKNVTAAPILELAEQGKLSLDDPLSKYLSGIGGRDIRLRNLLSHTSGLANFTELKEWDALESKRLSHAQIVRLIAGRKPDFAPGTGWSYSNSGFYLLGMVAEHVSGKSYGALAGALLQHGDVVSKASLKSMTAPTRLADGTLLDYGLGRRLGALGGHAVEGHTGGGGDFSAVVEYFPKDDLSIAVLTDTGGTIPASAIAAALARALLHLPDTVADKPVPHAADYLGIYRSSEGALEVFAQDGKLAFRPPGAKEALGTLHYQGGDVFAIDPDTGIRVLRDSGKVVWAVGYDGGLFSDPKRRVQR